MPRNNAHPPHDPTADPVPAPLSIRGKDPSCSDLTEGDEGGGSSWLSNSDREKKRSAYERKKKN